MLSDNIWCVIMAGGMGTRIWPVSTVDVPKQFVGVEGENRNLIQATADRFQGLVAPERTLVVTNARHASLVQESLPGIPAENILVEPYKRDTAPCIAFAMYTILKRDPDAIMVVVPSDHIIVETEKFRKAVCEATEYVRNNDVLVTLGIRPTRPDANFGYIQGVSMPQEGIPLKVKTFTEKPDKELARIFVQSGEFLWNSGIFVWRAETICREFERFLPQMKSIFDGWQGALDTPFQQGFLERVYGEAPKLSIDYAIMEKTSSAWVFPADFGWYDIGTWESLYSFIPNKDDRGNAGNTTMMLQNCSNNLVLSTDKEKLVAMCDIEDYVVVNTGKVLLICPRDDAKLRYFLSNLAMPEFEKYR